MSDTPRTDALERKLDNLEISFFVCYIQMIEHARKLERELTEITEERDELRELWK